MIMINILDTHTKARAIHILTMSNRQISVINRLIVCHQICFTYFRKTAYIANTSTLQSAVLFRASVILRCRFMPSIVSPFREESQQNKPFAHTCEHERSSANICAW